MQCWLQQGSIYDINPFLRQLLVFFFLKTISIKGYLYEEVTVCLWSSVGAWFDDVERNFTKHRLRNPLQAVWHLIAYCVYFDVHAAQFIKQWRQTSNNKAATKSHISL